MLAHLVPCPTCIRHIRVDAGACPFCRTELPVELATSSRPRAPRLGEGTTRVALLFASATAVTACNSAVSMYGVPPGTAVPEDSGMIGSGSGSGHADAGSGGGDGGELMDSSFGALYGVAADAAHPEEASEPTEAGEGGDAGRSDSGNEDDSGTLHHDSGPIAVYGGPTPG